MTSTVHRLVGVCMLTAMLLLAVTPSAQAQKSRADSLSRVLKGMRKDTARVTVLIALVNAHLGMQEAADAERTAREALTLAEKLRSDTKIAESWLAIARCRLQSKDYDAAVEAANTALRSSQKRGDARGMATAYGHLGTIESRRNRSAEAVRYEIRAAEQYELASDADMSAYHYGIAGEWLNRRKQYAEALPNLEKSFAIRERLGVPAKRAVAHDRLGQALNGLGKYRDAVTHGETAVRLYGQLGQESKLAPVYNWLALAYQKIAAYEKARECVAHMMELGGRLENKAITAEAFLLRGKMLESTQLDSARVAFEQARALFAAAGDERGLSNVLKVIGDLDGSKGRSRQAMDYLRQSLAAAERARQGGNFIQISPILISLGNKASGLNELEEARNYYHKASVAAKEEDAPPYVLTTLLCNLGIMEYRANRDSLALSSLRNVRGRARNEGNWDNLITTYAVEGLIHQRQRAFDSAEADFEAALALARKHGNERWERNSTLYLASVSKACGQLKRAMELYYTVLRTFEKLGEVLGITKTLNDIAAIQNDLKLYDDALSTLRRSLALSKDLEPKGNYFEALYIQGLALGGKRDHRAALSSLSQAFTLGHTLDGMAIVAAAMSRSYQALGMRQESRDMFKRSLALRDSAGEGACSSCELLDHATFLMNDGQAQDAVDLLLDWQASDAGRKEDASTRGRILQHLSDAYSALGDHAQAMTFYKRAFALRDSVYTLEQSKILAEHSAKYDAERREQRIALLEKDKSISGLELLRQQSSLRLQQETIRRQQLESSQRLQQIQLLEQEQDIHELDLAYQKEQYERKQQEATLLRTDNQLKASILSRQEQFTGGVIGGLSLLFVVGLLGYKQARQKRKASELRAAAAEFQAKAAEYQAQAAEAEALRLQAEHDRRQKETQLEFARQLIDAQELERKRIASELHDSVGQEAMVIKSNLHRALNDTTLPEQLRRPLSKATTISASMLDDIRAIAYNLRPIQLERVGLSETLRETTEEVFQPTNIRLDLHVDDIDGLLGKTDEIHMFRIVQEAVGNVLRHAQAQSCELRVRREADRLVVSIRDDGIGFDTQGPGRSHRSLGLNGIRERAEIIGGSCTIESAPGRGTSVLIDIPVSSTPTAFAEGELS